MQPKIPIPNIPMLKMLLRSHFKNNITSFAREMGINRSQASLIINHGRGAGAQFFGGLYIYCKRKQLNFEDYIIFTDGGSQHE